MQKHTKQPASEPAPNVLNVYDIVHKHTHTTRQDGCVFLSDPGSAIKSVLNQATTSTPPSSPSIRVPLFTRFAWHRVASLHCTNNCVCESSPLAGVRKHSRCCARALDNMCVSPCQQILCNVCFWLNVCVRVCLFWLRYDATHENASQNRIMCIESCGVCGMRRQSQHTLSTLCPRKSIDVDVDSTQ